jgi:signal transduction histidine kinase
VEIWVIDDGNGIADADVERIFDDYTRGTDHGSAERGGFGLGLPSARRMAELMSGTLDLDRRWTSGCAFVLRLKLAEHDRARPVRDQPAAISPIVT